MALMVGIYFFLPIKQMLLFSKTFDFFLPSLPQGKKGLRIPDIQAALQSSNFCARYGVSHKNKVVQLGYYSGDRRHIFFTNNTTIDIDFVHCFITKFSPFCSVFFFNLELISMVLVFYLTSNVLSVGQQGFSTSMLISDINYFQMAVKEVWSLRLVQ